MAIKEKDFGLYVEWVPQGWAEETIPAVIKWADTGWSPEWVDAWTKSVEELAAEVVDWGTVPAVDWVVDWATAWAWSETPKEATTEKDKKWTTETVDDLSWDGLQKMLDALNEGSQESAEATKDIKGVAEEIKSSVSEWDVESQKKIDELLSKIALLETSDQKKQKTIDVLSAEYDKVINDKLSLEYWTASDSKIAQMVNEDPDIKNLLSAKMLEKNWAEWSKEKLIAAYKAGWESLTGQSLDALMSVKKSEETDALSWSEDASASVAPKWESLYL